LSDRRMHVKANDFEPAQERVLTTTVEETLEGFYLWVLYL